MKRFAIALIAGAALSTLVYASASALIVDGGTIQSGQDTTVCDSDGVKVNWGLETDDSTVRSVTIEGIAATCAGAELFVHVGTHVGTVAKIDKFKILLARGPDADIKVKFDFAAPYRTAESIDGVKVWIEG